MTTQDLEQIGNLLDQKIEPLKQGQAQTDKRLSKIEDGQAHISTAIDTLKAGQDDLRDHMDASFMDLGAKIDRTARDNKRLIEELEEQVNITNPHKN